MLTPMSESAKNRDQTSSNLYNVDASDPRSELIDRSKIDPEVVQHVTKLMGALVQLRAAEEKLSDDSLKYMKLNKSDMFALHYLMVSGNQGLVATPGAIATHLKISSASTTKLLDRLEHAGHIVREAHPTDRRALAISITPQTRQAAMNTVGRQQAKRFHAAARLTADERDVVIRFLEDTTREISTVEEPWI